MQIKCHAALASVNWVLGLWKLDGGEGVPVRGQHVPTPHILKSLNNNVIVIYRIVIYRIVIYTAAYICRFSPRVLCPIFCISSSTMTASDSSETFPWNVIIRLFVCFMFLMDEPLLSWVNGEHVVLLIIFWIYIPTKFGNFQKVRGSGVEIMCLSKKMALDILEMKDA